MIKTKKYAVILIFIATLICYISVLIPPHWFWPAGIFVYGILPFLFLNTLLAMVFLLKNNRILALMPVISLVLGAYFLKITFAYHKNENVDKECPCFSLLSLNAKLFRDKGRYDKFSKEMIRWAAGDTSAIKCFQEYSTNDRWPKLDVTKQISDEGYNSFVFEAEIPTADHHPGMAIFSRFPIINRGIIKLNENSVNNCIYADVVMNQDTIRIYNIHLFSMHITTDEYENPDNFFKKIKELIYKIRNGTIKRSNEIDLIIDDTKKCPYPFILCGDFNDISYSYNYLKLRRHFNNTFERAGNGFGITLNKKFLFFRIDQQFYSKNIDPVKFMVERNMNISDHFPTRGLYRLNKE